MHTNGSLLIFTSISSLSNSFPLRLHKLHVCVFKYQMFYDKLKVNMNYLVFCLIYYVQVYLQSREIFKSLSQYSVRPG